MRLGNWRRWKQVSVALMFLVVPLATSGVSRAQELPSAPQVPSVPEDVPPAMPQAPAVPSVPTPPPVTVATAAPAQDEPQGTSDFDVQQRRWALGYAGVSVVPTGTGSLTVPAVGLRYWSSPGVGVDVALGIGWTGGSTDTAGTSVDKNGLFGLIAQLGVPLVLSTHRHVTFQVIPYLTVAYGTTSTGTGTAEVDDNGLRVDVGARAGFELFFGFIGIPELALSATLGAQFEYLRNSQSSGGISATDTTFTISTTVQNNPWDIFTGNVAARYYF